MVFVNCLRKYFYHKFIKILYFCFPLGSLKYPTEKKCYCFIVLISSSSSKHLVIDFSLSLFFFFFPCLDQKQTMLIFKLLCAMLLCAIFFHYLY